MGKLAEHQSTGTTKLLLIGDPGTAKTGALASLAKAGYNLRILDMDNGLDILYHLLKNDSEAMERVTFETVTDTFGNRNGTPAPKTATAWPRAIKLLDHWKTPEYDLGKVTSWTSNDILVIDSLTLLGEAAMRFVLMSNGRLGTTPWQSDWMEAQDKIKGLCGMLYDKEIKCNVIIISHIALIGEEGEQQRGYPETLGKKLPPKIGRYFNSILMCRSKGAEKRIYTRSQPPVELKTPVPNIPVFYDIKNGLAEFFKAVREPAA